MSGIGPVLQDFLQDGRVLQKRIPHLEAPHVEIEAPTHCLIHAGDTISDLWREAGSVDKRIGGCLTRQLSRPVICVKHGEQALHRIVDVTRCAKRWEAHLLLRLVLERLEVQFQDGGLAIRIFNALVEALAALLTEPAAPHHLEYDFRHAEGLTPGIAGRVLVQVIGHVDSVSRPERSAVRKTADLGRPILGPRIVSTSPTVYPSSSARRSVDIELYTPMRLAIKLGVSLHSTTPLPSTSVANCCMYCTSAGSVSTPGTISSRRM